MFLTDKKLFEVRYFLREKALDFKVDISQFDHFFDAVAAFDGTGKVVYCNHTFTQVVGLSGNRVVNKLKVSELFLDIDDDLSTVEKSAPKEATNSRVVSFKTKSISEGTGQYCLIPTVYKNKKVTLFVLRDLSLEEKLKKKYHREMASKDSKIEEMKSIITLLQQTRLLKDPNSIIREFALHILTQLRLDRAYLLDPDKTVSLISQVPVSVDKSDILHKHIQVATLPDQYIAYSAEDLVNLKFGFVPDLETLVVVPVRTQQRSSYLLTLPIFKGSTDGPIDHENIRTLAEQMSVILENMDLERISIHDDLTKINNARYFREKLDECSRNYRKLSLILLDIDFFKKINDTYGHLAGDMVLAAMGGVLKNITVRDAVVARVGGEEFAVLIPNSKPEDVMKVAEELAEQIRALEINFEGKLIKITSSFGISHWNIAEAVEIRDFYKSADEALYKSKADGRNRITLYKAS